MRTRLLILFLAVIALSAAIAMTPPVPITLKERVQRASHIFVGTALKLRVVDEKGHEVSPQPEVLGLEQSAEMQVRVEDVLAPGDWHPKEPVTIVFGGGFFSVKDMQKDFVEKKWIFLTAQSGASFGASYPWHLVEALEKRAEIEGFIREKSK